MDPVSRRWKTVSRPSEIISTTDCENIKVETGKSSVVLRFHKHPPYLALREEQHDENRKWRSNNNESGNTKKNKYGGGENKRKDGGVNESDGNNESKKLRCLVSSMMVGE